MREIGTPRRLMGWMASLGEAQATSGDIGGAISTHTELLTMAETYSDIEAVTHASNNLGVCHLHAAHFREASQLFTRSAQMARLRPGGDAEANATYNQGWMRMLLLQWSAAARLLKKGAVAYEAYGAIERAAGAWSLFGWCRFRWGDHRAPNRVLRHVDSWVLETDKAHDRSLLRLALTRSTMTSSDYLSAANGLFSGSPSHQFHVLLWGIDTLAMSESSEHLDVLGEAALEAAVKSTHRANVSALHARLLAAGNRVSRALIEKSFASFPRRLEDLAAELQGTQKRPRPRLPSEM
jgi:hypothetical protein